MSEYKDILKDIFSGATGILKDILSRAESITRYSDGLRENLAEVNYRLFCTLHSGIEAIDDSVLSEIFHYQYVWAFNNRGLFFAGKEDGSVARDTEGGFQHTYSIHNASRTLLVEGVKRLPAFLKIVAENLQTKEHEIKPSYEAANKILRVVETLVGEERSINEGWAIPPDDVRFHYFMDGKSLCGSYKYLGALQADDWQDGPSDCKKCREKLKKKKPG